jgi:hypothetical protein
MDLFSLVYTIGSVVGVWCGFQESLRVGFKVLFEALDLGLVRIGGYEGVHEILEFYTESCKKIGGLLLIGHVANLVCATVYGTLDWYKRVLCGEEGFYE